MLVNLARKLKVDPEAALASGNDKFTRRFHAVERQIADSGSTLGQATLEEMDAAWDAAKAER